MCVCSFVSRPCWGKRVSTSTRWATLSCPSTLWPTPRSVDGQGSACRALLFFPLSAAASSSYSLLSAFFCHPLSFHVTMYVVLFLFFFPIQRSDRSQAVDVKLSGALTVARTESVCVLLVRMDYRGTVSWLVLPHVLFHLYFLLFLDLCL